jgi:hypothetical protein
LLESESHPAQVLIQVVAPTSSGEDL